MGMEYFGDKLKELRMSRHWTQEALGKRLNLVGATISAYESSAMYPSVDVLINLCHIFNVSADYLLDLSTDKSTILSTATLTDKQLEICLNLIEEFEHYNALKEK